MKRSEINAAVARAIANSQKCGIALPRWAAWAPEEFGESAEGMRQQKLGWKVVKVWECQCKHPEKLTKRLKRSLNP